MKTNRIKFDKIKVACMDIVATLSINFSRLVLFLYCLFMIFIHQSTASDTGQFMPVIINLTFPNLE